MRCNTGKMKAIGRLQEGFHTCQASFLLSPVPMVTSVMPVFWTFVAASIMRIVIVGDKTPLPLVFAVASSNLRLAVSDAPVILELGWEQPARWRRESMGGRTVRSVVENSWLRKSCAWHTRDVARYICIYKKLKSCT